MAARTATAPGAPTTKLGHTAYELDDRLVVSGWMRRTMNKVYPDHWSFLLGEICLYSFVVLVLTGVYLTLFFDPSMTRNLVRRKEIEAELRVALQRDELSIFFQPIIDLETGRIRTFEALIRWFHPEKGELRPDEFIPVAEETGMMVAIGEWVIDDACRAVADGVLPVQRAVQIEVHVALAPGALAECLGAHLREHRVGGAQRWGAAEPDLPEVGRHLGLGTARHRRAVHERLFGDRVAGRRPLLCGAASDRLAHGLHGRADEQPHLEHRR
mgnify:CR=1 FL=1